MLLTVKEHAPKPPDGKKKKSHHQSSSSCPWFYLLGGRHEYRDCTLRSNGTSTGWCLVDDKVQLSQPNIHGKTRHKTCLFFGYESPPRALCYSLDTKVCTFVFAWSLLLTIFVLERVLCVLLWQPDNFLKHTLEQLEQDLLIAKSRRLEIRQPSSGSQETSALPLVLSVPINGRLTCMTPLRIPNSNTSYLFLMTDKLKYSVVSYHPPQQQQARPQQQQQQQQQQASSSGSQAYPLQTHASGTFRSLQEQDAGDYSLLGNEAECAPLISVEPFGRFIALHLFDGLITFIPIHLGYSFSSSTTPVKGVNPTTTLPRRRPLLGEPYHLRIEERRVLSIAFLQTPSDKKPQLALLHQDARGLQHVMVHGLDPNEKTQWIVGWKKSRIDGGSAQLIGIPSIPSSVAASSVAASSTTTATATAAANTTTSTTTTGGVLILGQRQITYVQPGTTKVVPIPQCLLLTHTELPPSDEGPRYLLGDDLGNLHMLSVKIQSGQVVSLDMDTLGSTNVLTSDLTFLEPALVFCGSKLGDSQLIQIHPEATADQGYISVLEEYTNLGPIVDMDWIPTHNASVVTASGSSIAGTLRVVRNGIGMKEYAGVEIPGIQDMWSLRASYSDKEDSYLVQSFVGETRVLGVGSNSETSMDVENEDGQEEEEEGATLEEVVLSGLDSTSSTLFVGNVELGNVILQITETEIRLLEAATFQCVSTWTPEVGDLIEDTSRTITVASANEAGQVVVALRGGLLVYLRVEEGNVLTVLHKKKMDKEVSCVDLNPFADSGIGGGMEVDSDGRPKASLSQLVAVGLWDDFTVRLLSLEESLGEQLSINLSTEEDEESDETDATGGRSPVRRSRNNMMARSLCLVTLDSSYSSSSASSSFGASSSSSMTSVGVNMLFVGLGDGTLISFVVVQQGGNVTYQSRKEVSLGTQRINLIPLQTELGGTCVLATGDRPTVIYLAGGVSTNNLTPKLCYSNVNLSESDMEEEDVSSRPRAQQSIAVSVATPFHCPQLFDDSSLGSKHYSLCVSDDSILRLGVIDDIQKLHVTTCRLGMAPRRVAHCPEGRLFAVGCVESGIKTAESRDDDEISMANCVRFLDDTTFDDIETVSLEPHEMLLSMVNVHMTLSVTDDAGTEEATKPEGIMTPDDSSDASRPYLLVGTAYALPDEDEPSRGRILVYSCEDDNNSNNRGVRLVTELQVRGGVYIICQFYNGMVLVGVNSKTLICRLSSDGGGAVKLGYVGIGHHGHMLSLYVKSRAPKLAPNATHEEEAGAPALLAGETPTKKKPPRIDDTEQLAIVGDLMRSIALVQYYPEHQALEEIARDFNANWTTAVEMLTDSLYLGAENWNNIFKLRRNAKATSEEVRCRLETTGEYHLGEMCNKFVNGSLVMPQTTNTAKMASTRRPGSSGNAGGASSRRKSVSSPSKSSRSGDKGGLRSRRPTVTIGSQTLFGTVDGTLGSILGLDARTAAFFTTLARCMAKVIRPVGDFSHHEFRMFDAEGRVHPSHGFVDGDLVESFLDLDRGTMEAVVDEMNRDGGWEMESHSKSMIDDDDGDMPVDNSQAVLVVEDVLAMVEEMTMFH